jgi:oxaloacetate decarboxylase (Na+ extruding) subunit alpha
MAKIKLTDLVLRDAHQSLLATRMVTADMLPACERLDKAGYFALEAWGGATFDTCIRFLNEDPWDRLRQIKKAAPKTPIMMLLRGQNLLGYRHYADDVVDKFVEAAARNGVDVFRIFDACNDPRNLKRATDAAKRTGKHVQATISYATTPFHTIPAYVKLAKDLAAEGADSLCIKDMAGLLKPYDAYELVKALKKEIGLPVEVHSHATTGMSVATLVKAAEAGADVLDTCISSMAMGTSHSPTETLVEIFKGTEFETGMDVKLLVDIAAYFREVRKKYAKFESSFLGADTRILIAQVPGGMLSNMESQLKEQGAGDRIDEVLKEIPRVQKDAGFVPLVTPTSQIVGTQAVFNVLFGRYQKMTAEFKDLIVGKYGATPAPCDAALVAKALAEAGMAQAVTHRPADDIPNEFAKLEEEAKKLLGAPSVSVEDVLTYAMFPKVAPDFFKTRSKGPVSFKAEEAPAASPAPAPAPAQRGTAASYVVTVNGSEYSVNVRPEGTVALVSAPVSDSHAAPKPAAAPVAAAAKGGKPVLSPVAGSLIRYTVKEGDAVKELQTILIVESMKMELEVKAHVAGKIHFVASEKSKIGSQQLLAEIL